MASVALNTAALLKAIKQKKEADAIALLNAVPAPNINQKKELFHRTASPLVHAAYQYMWTLVVELINRGAKFDYGNDLYDIIHHLNWAVSTPAALSPANKLLAENAAPIKAIIDRGVAASAANFPKFISTNLDWLVITGGQLTAPRIELFKKIIDLEVARLGIDTTFYQKHQNQSTLELFYLYLREPIFNYIKTIGVNISGLSLDTNPIVDIATKNFFVNEFADIFKLYKKLGGQLKYGDTHIFDKILDTFVRTVTIEELKDIEDIDGAISEKDFIFYPMIHGHKFKADFVLNNIIQFINRELAKDDKGEETYKVYALLFHLLEKSNPDKLKNIADQPGFQDVTPLHIAVSYDALPLVKYILNMPSTKDWINHVYGQNTTVLHQAARDSSLKTIQLLLEAGADKSAKMTTGTTPCDIAKENNRDAEIIAALCDEEAPAGAPYKGMSRGDASLLDKILTPAGLKPTVMCPICLELIELGEHCNYITHNCKESATHYHKGLYTKYKNAQGNIVLCVVCGRICVGHAHYKLAWAHEPKPEAIFVAGADPYEDDCRPSGGGGLLEKFARFQRFREFALTMQAAVGKMPDAQVRDMLIEATWNAPFTMNKPAVEKILSTKRWNLPTELFANSPPKAAAAAAPANYNDPSKYGAPTISDEVGHNNIGYLDDEWVVKFNHERGGAAGGRLGAAHKTISKDTLMAYLQSSKGACPDAACGGLLWPAEVDMAVDLWKAKGIEFSEADKMVGNTRILADKKIIAEYRARFAREQAPAAAGAGGGAAHIGGSRSKTTQRTRMSKTRKSASPLAPTQHLQLIRIGHGFSCALPSRSRKTRRRRH